MDTKPAVQLIPWAEGEDFVLLLRQNNSPAMTRFLGGPETDEQLADRHRRYLALSAREPAAGRMFMVIPADGGEPVGTVGFWERDWQDEPVYETGWGIRPEFQGRGLALAAVTSLIAHARTHGTRPHLHAFPGIDNAASNAVCRNAGFELLGETTFEYRGTNHRSNDWHHPLR
ncbi:GNAT family N-acetyltransferase [Streptomyces venezuelae]|uniref:GNAT family N-acetyltransferase n=1 Tax=Streptomyces venezuelae TaxID=54571 RepID=A0A5P2D2Z3_STRVZ|nr:GNAT family N-acetyltransferase [Streptomyces venezuelae]QES49534.1 GNAT family N-acetyltransferase [Streptomyces venezuelae]